MTQCAGKQPAQRRRRLRRERGDSLDPSGAADGAGDLDLTVVGRQCGFRRVRRRGDHRAADQSPRSGDLLRPMAVRQESVVADTGKPARQDVQQESADEFVGQEGHGLLSVVVGVILPLEGDALAVKGRQARIGDRRAMGVAGQILQHLLCAAKGWLGVDDPVGPNRLIKQALEGLAVGVPAQHAEETELSATKSLLQSSDELAAKDTTQNAHREEEVGAPLDPLLAVGRKPAGGHHAVQVGMMHQVLSPRVQDGEKTDLGAEMLGLGGNLQERLGSCLEQDAVDDPLIRQCQGAQLGWQREHHVKIRNIEQFRLPRLQPSRAGRGLTLGAVTIATRIVGEAAISAGVARLFVSAQGGGAASGEIAEGLALLVPQDGAVAGQQFAADGAKDIA